MSATVADPGVGRWLSPLLESLPGLAILDAHTQLGIEVDGALCQAARLTAALEPLGARAVTFSAHIDGGDYRHANDAVIEAAATSADRLVAFCRLNPHTDALGEGRQAVAAGARGIKLHPRSERFTLAHPRVKDVFALAHEHGLAVLIHAGHGIDPLGADALALASAYPAATVILAHAAISDLAWITDELHAHPNIVFDTACSNPADLLALFALVPPGRIVFGSAAPFADIALCVLITLRCALAVGLDREQIQSVMGGRLERLLAAEQPPDLGPALGARHLPRNVLLDRAMTYLSAARAQAIAGQTARQQLELARMALEVNPSHPHREICDAAIQALDIPANGDTGAALAAALVATPDVPVAPPTGASSGVPATTDSTPYQPRPRR